MPRLRHICFWLATGLSLAVFVLTAISFGWNDPRTLADVYVPASYYWEPLRGDMLFSWTGVAFQAYRYEQLPDADKGPAPPWSPEHWKWMDRIRAHDTAIFFLGFHYDKRAHFDSKNVWDGYEYNVGVRYVTVFVLSAILPVVAILKLVRWRRARRAVRMGLCPGCRYDLRASSDRCPECGRPIEAKA